mgnify:CR=1 FL=1
MALEAYAHYWNSQGYSDGRRKDRMRQIRDRANVSDGFGGSSDPLGAQSPMVQDSMLQQLGRRAAGRIDDWESLVDPTLTYGENLARIQEQGGKSIESEKRTQREKFIASNENRQQRRAKSTIRENLSAVEAGEADEMVADIKAEFGSAFVSAAIEEARVLEAPTTAGAPEASEPASAPEPTATPTSTDVTDSPRAAATKSTHQSTIGAVTEAVAFAARSVAKSTKRTARESLTASSVILAK